MRNHASSKTPSLEPHDRGDGVVAGGIGGDRSHVDGDGDGAQVRYQLRGRRDLGRALGIGPALDPIEVHGQDVE